MTGAAMVHIRDDVWTLRSIALFVVGLCIALVGIAPQVGLAVTAVGATVACVALASIARRVGFDVDSTTRRIVIRHAVTSSEISFADIAYISVRSPEHPATSFDWLSNRSRRFDVILVRRGADEVLIREDLEFGAARNLAAKLGVLVGTPVIQASSRAVEKTPAGRP